MGLNLATATDPLTGGTVGTTRLDYLVDLVKKYGINWSRKNSLWPMPYATACCGIEFMAAAASRYDIARFGSEACRFSPRQSDLLIVAGRVVMKMLPVLQRIYVQMAEPKWVVSMGACASSGGVFDTYAVVQGIDQFLPVDVYIPGCPPRPETIHEAIMAIQRIVREDGVKSSKERGQGLRLVIEPPQMVQRGSGVPERSLGERAHGPVI
ncbi:MAG: NADH-quinone oxidoreductase subunit NuoB [Planctomycetes bacterium]|nr:NADH-quinone oxidoreductase subunit NuoB [Planctomycetota bacterium]